MTKITISQEGSNPISITLHDNNRRSIESDNPAKDAITTTLLRQTIEKIDISNFKTANVKMSKLSSIADRFIQDSSMTLCVSFDIIKISKAVGNDIVILTNKLVDVLNKTEIGKKLVFLKIATSNSFYIYDNIAEHESDNYDISIYRKNINSLCAEINKSTNEKLKELRNYLSTTGVDYFLKDLFQKYKITYSNIKKAKKPSIRLCDEYHYFSTKINGLSKYLELDLNPDHLIYLSWFDNETHSWKHDENNVWARVQFKNNCGLDKFMYGSLSLPKEFENFKVKYDLYFESICHDGLCWIKRTKPIAEMIKIAGDDSIKKIKNDLKDFDSGNILIHLNITYDAQ